jgi:hypothetical protein
VPHRQRGELYDPACEECVAIDEECVGPFLHEGRKGRIDVVIGLGGENCRMNSTASVVRRSTIGGLARIRRVPLHSSAGN